MNRDMVEGIDWLVLTRKTWFDDKAARFWSARFGRRLLAPREFPRAAIQIAGRLDINRGIG